MTYTEYYHRIWDLVHRKNEYDAAMELIAEALAGYPDGFGILDLRADVYKGKGENEKALADYTRMIALMPRNPDGWNHRGLLYQELGEYDKAIADFTECISLSPEGYGTYWSNRGIAYREKGDLDAALSDLTTSIETWKEPESTPWALFHRGIVWRKKGELDKALEDFMLAAARDPKDDEHLYQAGYIWFLRKEHEKAIGYFSKAIALRDDVADYWLSRGVCYWNQCVKDKTCFWGKEGEIMDLAEKDFTKAIACDPDMADAWFDRGMVRCAKARNSHDFIKTILTQKVTDNAERAVLLARLEYIGGHDLVPQADALLRGLRADRDEVDGIMAGMLGLFAENDAREAVEDLTRAAGLDPGNAEAYYQRGLAYTLLGKKDKALADYEQTLILDPGHKKAAEKRDKIADGERQRGFPVHTKGD
jgi:tetratricopeptide (TPR) repeat protein